MRLINPLVNTITKFSNVIGNRQPNLRTNRKVYTSCLQWDNVIGQLMSHTYARGHITGV